MSFQRSSVWVNQEVAILAYRQFAEARTVPILCFLEPGVSLEGAMTSLIVNPKSFESSDAIAVAVRKWLATASFHGVSNAAFVQKWNALDENARMVVASLIEEGGHAVAAAALASSMRRLFGDACADTANCVLRAELIFQNTGVVRGSHTDYGKEFSLQATWESSLRRAVAEWLRGRGRVV